jgi:hypothetical protein
VSPEERLKLAKEIFDAVFNHFDTFRDDNIGADLAYLLGAILCDDDANVDWTEENYGNSGEVPKFIEESFPKDHPVWGFIVTDKETTCPECQRSWGPHYRGPCDHSSAPCTTG